MPMNVVFPFTCSCGVSGSLMVPEPISLNVPYMVSGDCRGCGKAIVIVPTLKISDYAYEYTVKIYKIEREEKTKTPPK